MSETIKQTLKQLHASITGLCYLGEDSEKELIEQAISALSAEQPEPFGYFHELLNHEGKGTGVWVGCPNKESMEKSHIDGETGKEIVTLYASPIAAPASQPTKELDDAIEEATERMWRVHPADLQDEGITRKQYYKREIAALVRSSQPDAAAICRKELEETHSVLSELCLNHDKGESILSLAKRVQRIVEAMQIGSASKWNEAIEAAARTCEKTVIFTRNTEYQQYQLTKAIRALAQAPQEGEKK